MQKKKWRDHGLINPTGCFGKPCMKGTRIWVSLVVDNLPAGATEEEILEPYPSLTHGDIRQAPAFAPEMAREWYVPIQSRGGSEFHYGKDQI
jgi:uncharacterized protein (DUF433 family)